jgi:plasmid stabilization system protein ParE
MALQIVWSPLAEKDQEKILRYWAKRNKSNVYPQKLHAMITDRVDFIASSLPKRYKTSVPSIYYEYVREYRIYYKVRKDEVVILRIWDGRRNPDKQPFRNYSG